MSGSVQNYINTLIFAIVAKAVTVLLLGLLFTDIGKMLAFFILTVEFGLVTIIVISLWQIYAHDKKRDKEVANLRKAKVNINQCPDYYTKMSDGKDGVECDPVYRTPDGAFEYTFTTPKFPLSTFKGKTFTEVCDIVQKENPSDGIDFTEIPWTDIKAKCYSLEVN